MAKITVRQNDSAVATGGTSGEAQSGGCRPNTRKQTHNTDERMARTGLRPK
jgi:hypothetical protein